MFFRKKKFLESKSKSFLVIFGESGTPTDSTARGRKARSNIRSSPTSDVVCGARPAMNSGQPVAFIE